VTEEDNLGRALGVLTGLGFRVDTIIAADDPDVAVLSGHGVTLRLTREKHPAEVGSAPLVSPLVPSFVVTRNDSHAWKTGRAGMLYRDLVPGRQGGRFIASHIRITEGGPVPDYVHFHAIHFQMIYVHKGWVRVVYEDQGPPFVMHEGDCALQPPRIRHRVLESSPGLEVIEVGSPAIHATHADHETSLPTSVAIADRDFDGQRFSWHRADGRALAPRNVGIDAATRGRVSAHVRNDTTGPASRTHDHELFFGFVLRGSMAVTFEGGTHRLAEADAFAVPAHTSFELGDSSPDLAWLCVTAPAQSKNE
jgi:quercetin dioxygenase-like cupin family protein